MSYSLMLRGSHRSAEPVRRISPFTRAPVEVHLDLLDEGELRAVEDVLARHPALAQALEVRPIEDERGPWTITPRSFGPEIAAFVFELATAGAFVVERENAEEPIVTTEAARARLHGRGETCVVARSAEELHSLVAPEFEAWATWAATSAGIRRGGGSV
jgi:hypothetical protein